LQRSKISAIWAGDDWAAILFYTGTPWIPWSACGAVTRRPRHRSASTAGLAPRSSCPAC